MPKIQIQIVTYNSEKHLEQLFKGIKTQTSVDFEVLVIDNASTDNTVERLEKNAKCAPHPRNEFRAGSNPLPEGDGTIHLVHNTQNNGFAKAHNQGFALCQAPYVLVLNHDVILEPDSLHEMLKVMESNNLIAAVVPALFKELPKGENYGIVDTLGLQMKPWGQVVNIGENKPYKPKNEPTSKVWGASGSCVLYRLSDLKQVADQYGIYDERFWMYKEDADLSWRLDRAGFKTVCANKAVATHSRSVQRGDRKTRPLALKKESIRNHLLMLKKNLGLKDLWRIPLIVVYEIAKFVYVALFERESLGGYGNTMFK